MKFLAIPLLLLTTLVSAGCVGKMPQTADEFRQALPSAFMGKLETYEVDRSAADIGKTFSKYAPKCLDVRIETTSQTQTSYQYIVTRYTPTVIVDTNRTELHLQEKHEKGVLAVYEEPAVGHYLMVVDATPIGPNRSKIDFYRPSMGFDTMATAVRNWTRGENLGCPDLTK
jgi:hypothetical protein